MSENPSVNPTALTRNHKESASGTYMIRVIPMTSDVRHVRRISNPCRTIAIWAEKSGEFPNNAGHHRAGKAERSKQDGAEQHAARHQHVYQQPCVRLRRSGEQQADPEAADNGNPVEQPLDDDRSQSPYPRQSIGFLEEFCAKELTQPCRHDGIEPVADEQARATIR